MFCSKILKYFKRDNGFTMVEIAVVIMMSGFILVMAAQFIKLYTVNLKREKTLEHLDISESALFEFLGRNGRYPCPADPTLTLADANFGREQCRSIADLTNNQNNCNGAPANLSCTTVGSRDGDENGFDDVVMIGIFPFRTVFEDVREINYTQNYRFDAYSIYLSYAVTEHMSDRSRHNVFNPVNVNNGGVRVLDENGLTMTIPESSAHYVLYSHGDNGVGGYTSSGNRVDGCEVSSIILSGVPGPPGLPDPGINPMGVQVEIENCDNNDAIFVKGIRSIGNNASYNDDMLMFTATGTQSLWAESLASPATESYIYNTNRGNVGVGTNDPTHDLHIAGDLSVSDGNTISNSYCDGVSTDCLLPSAIAGAGSRCINPRQVAYAVQDNQIVCRDVDWVMPAQTCPAGEYLVAFSNLGTIICEAP